MLRHWDERTLQDLLAANLLSDAPEAPFPNDGWSGATLTQLRRGDDRLILKRTSWAHDWIARATRDHALREGFVATGQLPLPAALVAPYLGAAADGTAVAMLMPDLSSTLVTWERPDGRPTLTPALLDRVLEAIVRLHASPPPADTGIDTEGHAWPWCPLRERLLLLSPRSAARFDLDGVAAGARFLAGWSAFAELAPRAALDLVERLDHDPTPLLAALERLPPALLHGDLKVANVALLHDGRVAFIDWQMLMVAPIAVDLGWLLAANSSALPTTPTETLERYRSHWSAVATEAGAVADDGVMADWAAQRDLAVVTGLLLRGWRKGLDASGGHALASGVPARDDLAWWATEAVEAAGRRL